ncbi:hypothetical protein NECAME_10319 [Necator americanus]|uniref:Uncharacterized protein n=1 Tax=Necator americanus TaxID=51031 RepID=W2T911_NECAM|nr:hypothetical protein NECAME_10319 [Necator americanus]ETN78500.1 hypothetical protein NECAME_10319 [Necator americanus]
MQLFKDLFLRADYSAKTFFIENMECMIHRNGKGEHSADIVATDKLRQTENVHIEYPRFSCGKE